MYDNPELFGLHTNADITSAQALTYNCLATLLKLQPKQVGGAATSQEEDVSNAAKNILDHLPRDFDLIHIMKKYVLSFPFLKLITLVSISDTLFCTKNL